MTRNELITEWCKREGGKKEALNAPEARQALAKLRAIIGEDSGVDLYEVIAQKCAPKTKWKPYLAFTIHWPWVDGKPVKQRTKRAAK